VIDSHSMEIELEAELEFEIEPYSRGGRDEPPSGGNATLIKVTIGTREIPTKEWAEYGLDRKRIQKLEESAYQGACEADQDAKDAAGDARFHELKDEGLI